ncbi:hypothetical protein Hanom_Chr09g00860041 [Helianthus anomalus]
MMVNTETTETEKIKHQLVVHKQKEVLKLEGKEITYTVLETTIPNTLHTIHVHSKT